MMQNVTLDESILIKYMYLLVKTKQFLSCGLLRIKKKSTADNLKKILLMWYR